MADSFLSSDWYRVAPLKPRLRGHVDIHRQRFRGDIWYVVQDHHSGKYHRITPAGNLMLSLMDGRRSLQQLWELACDRFQDNPPTQPEVIQLLSQLHSADLVTGDTLPDMAEIGERHREQSRRTMLSRLRNPLALRLPLLDPDRFLQATLWIVRPLFTRLGFLMWLALVLGGVVLAVMNWAPLTEDLQDRILTAQNIFLIALAFPLVKAIHELGHAYATKIWGGEVHEVGVMFLVFIPVPYVDASSSAAFPEKWRRAIVGGAGIMVELSLAALALIFWLNAEPGLARAFAFNVMLIGGVSTLLFNGNPLLRFDGYFVLADLVEIPNLGQRSNRYVFYLCQRYLLGLRDSQSPVTARGERRWLLGYAVAAFLYRASISVAISLFVASKFFFVGVMLAIWAVSNMFVFPVVKGLWWLFTAPAMRGHKARGSAVLGAGLACLGGAVFALPLPHATTSHAVLWLDEAALIRAETEGVVQAVPAAQAAVTPGTLLVQLEDPILAAETRLAEAQLQEIRLRLDSAIATDPVQTRLLREQIRHLSARLDHYQARQAALQVTAEAPGQVVIPVAEDLVGRHVLQGDLLGFLVQGDRPRYRLGVPEDRAEFVRAGAGGVSLRLMRDLGTEVPVQILAAAPEGAARLPSPALSTEAGGAFVIDPTDPEQRRILQPIFLFDVAPDAPLEIALIGERALVRFDHGAAPLGPRLYRGLRQLFLRQFNV